MKGILIFLVLFKVTFSYINIHPTYFDKRIDEDGSYQEYTLYNKKNEPVMYKIYTEEDKMNPDEMYKWIEFYPRSIILKPGETGKIQVHIKSPSNVKSGEYFAVLGIKELPVFEKVAKEVGAGVSIFTNFRLIISGYVGNINPKLKFKNLSLKNLEDDISIAGEVSNLGKRKGKFELYLDEYYLGNLKVLSNENLNLDKLGFIYSKDKTFKIPKNLILKDYETKKEVGRIKL
ncbi:MAG: hypothetical protein RSC71_03835 [Cetobacterium sp.]|uniref:hypothetical protein n=1 Tax=Cetobacterium sp. TaxID=2071632 RepID=UPI002FC5E4DF